MNRSEALLAFVGAVLGALLYLYLEGNLAAVLAGGLLGGLAVSQVFEAAESGDAFSKVLASVTVAVFLWLPIERVIGLGGGVTMHAPSCSFFSPLASSLAWLAAQGWGLSFGLISRLLQYASARMREEEKRMYAGELTWKEIVLGIVVAVAVFAAVGYIWYLIQTMLVG